MKRQKPKQDLGALLAHMNAELAKMQRAAKIETDPKRKAEEQILVALECVAQSRIGHSYLQC